MDTALALSPAVEMETGNGFIVISRKVLASVLIRDARWVYSYEHCADLGEAQQSWHDLETGEYGGWYPVRIVAARDGIPLGGACIRGYE